MILKMIFHIFLFLFLTILTQIGGIVYAAILIIHKKKKIKGGVFFWFLGVYLLSTLVLVPIIAPLFGREKVVITENIKPTNYMTVLMNRNYVKPELNQLLKETSKHLEVTGENIQVRFLDANFPFINKFPLLPHLSHHDGKKIDLSFVYENKEGKLANQQKSMSGYGAFAEPTGKELNQIEKCKSAGYWQYDFTRFTTFGTINKELIFSEKGTKILIESLLKNKSLGKIFIEPHLKTRMGLASNKVRYHGCQAVRHDDHIHVQLK